MYYKLLQLLNVKPHESAVVKKLFTIQFFLGVATAFLFTSSLTMFLSTYSIKTLPDAYILSACLLLVFNVLYSYLEEKFSSPKLLAIVISFSGVSILLFWILLNTLRFHQLPLIIAGWYMLIYMLVGYAFWGMASILFNVRESKRLFSIVGAGDIPAKMLGYFSVTALVPFIGVNNLLWVSILSFCVALYLINRFQDKGLLHAEEHGSHSHSDEHQHNNNEHYSGFLSKLTNNRLVLFIAILSLVSYIVFAFIDFTFLSDIKTKYKHGDEIATFIAVFFATGRFLAVGIKILFSSRMISRIGLTNALLVTPVLLLLIAAFIIVSGDRVFSHLYVFGFMVLLTEILRSTLQEPVFFILFQPLKPHDRLRGHLVAKGHTMPFALLAVGIFLVLYLQKNPELPIQSVAELLIALLLLWIVTIFIIKKEYLQTLISSLKKGYFTGAELFLDNPNVTAILIKKTESEKPLEVIHSLNLLERSDYNDIYKLLLKNLHNTVGEIKEYVLARIIANNMTSALPVIKQQLAQTGDEFIKPALVKAFYFLNNETETKQQIEAINSLDQEYKKAAMEGLLNRKEEKTEQVVLEKLLQMANGSFEDKMLVLDIIIDCRCENYTTILGVLLNDTNAQVYKKAIEAAGKAKDIKVLPKVTELAAATRAYPSLRRAVSSYGDIFYGDQNLKSQVLPEEMLALIVKTAGNIKGENSTNYLVNLLEKNSKYFTEIIEALWLKKTKLSAEAAILIEKNINERIEESKWKVNYYQQAINSKTLVLLQQGIMMEIRKDVQILMKSFALMYEREKINRVIELLSIGNAAKISNAIEILELTIPKKYFIHLNNLVELIDDVQHHDQIITKSSSLPVNTIIEQVLKDDKANFSEWTKSVACYIIPKLKNHEVSLSILEENVSKKSLLFNETRDYVLSMLK